MPNNIKPILVTGAHRTGTTWVGKMLAASDEAAYISEPLNVLHRPGVMRTKAPYWYQYIHTHNQQEYEPAFREMLQLRYHPWLEIKSLRSSRDLLRMLRDWRIFYVGKKHRQRPLLKDPFAVFSIPWFYHTLGCQVVVTVRHPAAFVSSLKRLNWPFDFNHLLSQSELMHAWLEPYRLQMQTLVNQPDNIISQASLLWCMIYQVVQSYREQIPDLLVVRHEDLSANPIGEFTKLYDRLGLHFTQEARETILGATSSKNPKELSNKKVHAVQLDSKANISNWKRRLHKEEIEHIHEYTAQVARIYYPEESWA
jgi:hypothetical protein